MTKLHRAGSTVRPRNRYELESERVVPAFFAGLLIAASLAIVVAFAASRVVLCGAP